MRICVELTLANALKYNPPSSIIHNMAKTLSRVLEKKWKIRVFENKWKKH
jgi:hypothetical protein